MAECKHTPGPWIRDSSSGARCDVRAENGRKVALCWGLSTSKGARENSSSYRAECDANARLIAAAPDLLVAVQRCLNFIEGSEAEIGSEFECGNLARAAISKAEGRHD